MKKRIKKIFQQKIFKYVLIPVFLLGLWAILSVVYMVVYDKSFLVLAYNLPSSDFQSVTYDRLTKGHKITGEFVANENNLGILEMRFVQFLRIPYNQEDILVFRIKEKGQKNWYYEDHIRSGVTTEMALIPLGFPVIADSKGKTYDFEMESLRGNSKNGVMLSPQQPNLVSKYQVKKHAILSNPRQLIMFAFKKIVISSQTQAVIFSSFVYSLPFLIYIIYLTPLRKVFLTQFDHFKQLSLFSVILLIVVFIDVFFLQMMNDILYIFLMIAWIVSLKMQSKSSTITFVFGIFLLFLTTVFYLLNEITLSLAANIWAYAFLMTATIQILFAIRNSEDN